MPILYVAMEGEVTLENTDWIRVLAAMRNGVDEIPDDEQREKTDALIDDIIDQAGVSTPDLIELEAELRFEV